MIAIFCGLAFVTSAADAPQTGKPNIVFIMADDLGWGEVIQ